MPCATFILGGIEMKALLSTALLACALLFVATISPPAAAQERAYAPENLRTLSYNDQVRVISLEYREQSRGRPIPDDQLRFYLDQVNRSNWTFSRIKQDIAASLDRNDPSNPGQGNGPGPIASVTCESQDGRYRECRTGFRGPAALTQNISSTRCLEGQNWGSRSGMVWVDKGCRGRFVEAMADNRTIRCESPKFQYRECRTGFRGQVLLTRQISQARCIEGQTWGQRNGSVWVNRGCAAEFTQIPDSGPDYGSGYTVTCSSEGGRRKTCAWNGRQGRPAMIQQLSRDPCREGYSWGYFLGNQIWVDKGCRARFGVRR